MYGNIGKVVEKAGTGTGSTYLEPLEVHENCYFSSISYSEGTGKNNIPWKAIDYVIENENGLVSGKMFDFVFNPEYKKDGVTVPKETQLEEYGQRLVALFGNAVTEGRWEKGFAIKNPQTLKEVADLLNTLCVNQEKFRQKVILQVDKATGKGYSKVPPYAGQINERMSVPKAETKLFISKSELSKRADLKERKPEGTEDISGSDNSDAIPPTGNVEDPEELPF